MNQAHKSQDAALKGRVHQLRANFYSDGSCQLVGLPADFRTAMSMGATITLSIASHFVQAACAGGVDEKKIIVPHPSVLIPGMRG